MHSQESDMTDSDWSDWLPRAVADADPDTVALWYLGCNGFAIKGSGALFSGSTRTSGPATRRARSG